MKIIYFIPVFINSNKPSTTTSVHSPHVRHDWPTNVDFMSIDSESCCRFSTVLFVTGIVPCLQLVAESGGCMESHLPTTRRRPPASQVKQEAGASLQWWLQHTGRNLTQVGQRPDLDPPTTPPTNPPTVFRGLDPSVCERVTCPALDV